MLCFKQTVKKQKNTKCIQDPFIGISEKTTVGLTGWQPHCSELLLPPCDSSQTIKAEAQVWDLKLLKISYSRRKEKKRKQWDPDRVRSTAGSIISSAIHEETDGAAVRSQCQRRNRPTTTTLRSVQVTAAKQRTVKEKCHKITVLVI